MTGSEQKSPEEQKEARKRNLIVGAVLVALALFMYLSIIVKTAIMGP